MSDFFTRRLTGALIALVVLSLNSHRLEAAVLPLLRTTMPPATPSLTVILPRGVQRGHEHTLQFVGDRLSKTAEILLYDTGTTVSGFKVIDSKTIEVKIKVDADCRVGEHVAQIRTEDGISDFRSFYVGALPAVKEVEPNSNQDEAQPIEQNVTVAGVITNEDVDYFRIDGKKGQRLSVEIEALRLGAMFDPAISLLNEDRFELAISDDSPLTKQDGFFSTLLPADGQYWITVRESSFKGTPASRYRLHVGQFRRPVGVFPPGGKPGETLTLKFLDANPNVDGSLQTVSKEVQLPNAFPPRGGLDYSDEHGISPSPLPFRLSPLENVIEQEPNDTWVDTPALQLPIAINGFIQNEADLDYFKFHSKKGQTWHIRCFARQIGSGLDPVVNIFDANKKSVVGNDDSAKMDSYIRFDTPADGDYFLRVRDHLKQGQPDFFYRVEIEKPEPNLELTIPRIDRYSQQRQTIAVPQNNRFAVLFNAKREEFSGEIELLDDNLPPGITMVAPPMRSNLNSMPVVFEATADAPVTGTLVDFRGRHADPEKKISGSFSNRADFALGEPNNQVYWDCTVGKLAMAVINPVPFKLELVQPKVPMVRDGSIKLKVIAHREEGFDKPINLQFPFRSPGVGTTNQITLAADKTELLYPLNANDKAETGSFPMVVIGSSNVGGNAWVSTQMGQLDVAEPFVTMEFERAQCELGQSTKLKCKLEQLTPFAGEAIAEIIGIPANITINTPLKFTKDTTELTFDVTTTDKSPVGKHGGMFCQVTITQEDEPIVARAGKMLLHINKPKPVDPPK